MPSPPSCRQVIPAIGFTVAAGLAAFSGILGTAHQPVAVAAQLPAPEKTISRSTVSLSTLRRRIVSIAEGQLGYTTNPANTYCNKYSAYFVSGARDCPAGNMDEEWCADFAAWVWRRAGAKVVYQYINGDLNSSSESFYEWGVRMHTWHSIRSGYRPQPGDVAVYGLDIRNLLATHVAIVVGYVPGNRGPTAINGDGNLTGFSVVERRSNEFRADLRGVGALIAGYVSPS